jgi:hypothetical protein
MINLKTFSTFLLEATRLRPAQLKKMQLAALTKEPHVLTF